MNDSDVKTRRIDERNEPITIEELEHLDQYPYLKSALENLQGNILRGHGRAHSVHIFLSFKKDKKEEVNQWIKKLADHITSAKQQLDEATQYRQYGIPGRLFMSFFLSSTGYEHLGLDPNKFGNEAFYRGMKAAQHRLNDPPKEAWEKGYRENIDAMVLLADNDERFLLQEARKLIRDVQPHADVRAVEHGRIIRNAQGDSIEHFGYADSQSQPLFFQEDIDRSRQKGSRTIIWDPGAGLDLVLVPDPYGKKDINGRIVHYCSGSYLVFRKLEQNVRAYKEREKKLAKALGFTGEDAKRAGALVVGRFEDGTPVVLQPTAGRPTNNFTYDEDPDGEKCPLQAHIRKVNPRRKDRYEPIHGIVRRGITYGKRWKEPKDHPSLEELPTKDVGLLFMCYQKDIAEQFEHLQFRLANDPHFPGKHDLGLDPVIGQPSGAKTTQQKWPIQWNDPREKHKPFDFYGFVTLKGGEYFFAPSIYFIRNIVNIGKKY
jgi:Dyp-type peroxidase family